MSETILTEYVIQDCKTKLFYRKGNTGVETVDAAKKFSTAEDAALYAEPNSVILPVRTATETKVVPFWAVQNSKGLFYQEGNCEETHKASIENAWKFTTIEDAQYIATSDESVVRLESVTKTITTQVLYLAEEKQAADMNVGNAYTRYVVRSNATELFYRGHGEPSCSGKAINEAWMYEHKSHAFGATLNSCESVLEVRVTSAQKNWENPTFTIVGKCYE